MSDAWYARLVLGRPLLPLGITAVLAIAAIAVLPGFRVDAHGDSLTLENDPDRAAYERTRALFGGDDEIFVAVIPVTPWSRDTASRLEALAVALEGLGTVTLPDGRDAPGIDRVLSPTRIRLFRSLPDGTPALFAVNAVTLTSDAVDLAKAREELTGGAVTGGSLVARDGSAFALLARIADDPEAEPPVEGRAPWIDAERDREQARHGAIVDAVRDVAQAHAAPDFEIQVSGVPVLAVEMVRALRRDMVVFGSLALLVMALLLVAALRRVAWVVLPIVTVSILVAMVLAVTVLLGWRATFVTANLSALLVVIGLAHAIHLAVRLASESAGEPGLPHVEHVRRAVRGVARPCLYAALTTAIGFGSLAASDLRPNIDFGLSMAGGALLAWVLTFAVIPPLLVLLPPRRAVPSATGSDRAALEAAGRLVLRRPGRIAAAALVVTAISLAGLARVDVESRFTDHFREGDPLSTGLTLIDRSFGGLVPVEIVLRSGVEGTFRSDAGVAAVGRLHDALDAQPEIGAVLSLEAVRRDGVAALGAMMPIGDPAGLAFGSLVAMSERLLGADRVRALVSPYVDESWSTARVAARAKETAPSLDRRRLLESLRAAAEQESARGEVDAEVTGLFVLYANMLDSLARSTLRAALAVSLALVLMLAVLFRGPWIGIVAFAPNALPVLLVLGLLGLTGTALDMMSIMTASVTLGLAVDASIHFTFGYLARRAAGSARDEAIVSAYGVIGRAVAYTSLVVIGGFLVLMFSRFVPTARFGGLTALALAAALAASLLLLPVLLRHASRR